jgi:hypothetical protein
LIIADIFVEGKAILTDFFSFLHYGKIFVSALFVFSPLPVKPVCLTGVSTLSSSFASQCVRAAGH